MASNRDEPEYTGRDDRYLIDDESGADPYGVPPPMASSPAWQKPESEAPTVAVPPHDELPHPGDADVAVGDEAYAEAVAEHDSLADIYVKKAKLGEVGSGKLTIEEGLSGLRPDAKPPRTRLVLGVVAAMAVIAGIMSLFIVKRSHVDENLQKVDVSLARWIAMALQSDKEAAARQRLGDDDRAYLVTRSRLLDLYPVVFDYYGTRGEFPRRVADMKKAGLIADERLEIDGWEITVRIESMSASQPVVASAGADRAFGTPDDIRYAGGDFIAPPLYEDADAIPFVEQ